MKTISIGQLENKADNFFKMTEIKRKNFVKLLFNKQPYITALAHSFYAEESIAEDEGKEYKFTSEEVGFATDMLVFILYAMLPQDRDIPPIPGEIIKRNREKAAGIAKEISENSLLKQKGKNTALNRHPQKELAGFIFSEMLLAYDNKEIGDRFREAFILKALTLIGCLDGEIG